MTCPNSHPVYFQSGPSFLHINSMGWQFRLFLLAFLLSASLVSCQEEGSGEEEAEAASGKITISLMYGTLSRKEIP